jgi:polar amino acid transport system permease protein
VIKYLTDDPQTSTTDLYNVVEIVGEDKMIIGYYVGETADSVETVIDQLLTNVIKTSQVTRSGFIQGEDPATLTIRTTEGLITIPKDRVLQETRTDTSDGTEITVTYIDRVTVTGTMTKQNDKTMTVRTVDEQKETFDKSRILSREPCDPAANANCRAGDETILLQGEIIQGTLKTLSNTNLTVEVKGGKSDENRVAEIDYYLVPTLTIALYEPLAGAAILPGEEVRIGFVQGTDITTALDQLKNLNDVPVPLYYADGQARVALVSYPDLESALLATGAGQVSGMIYLDAGPNRLAVKQWVDDHEGSGVVLARPPAECNRDCPVTVKLVDQELTGRVENETASEITIVTTEAEYVVLDKSQIVENRRQEPAVCALNNLRGCDAGIFLTLRVTFLAYALAVIIGLFIGLMRVQTNPVLYAFSTLYVEVVRGIPLLVILLYAGFVISPKLLRDQLGIDLSPENQAVFGLAFGYGAFVAEIFRAGIQSVNRGQMEAARSLGMSYPQAMRFVVLPQAIRVVLPPLGNDFISMLKDSALISVLALPDLLQLGRLYVSRTFRAFEGYNTVAILYLAMTLFLSMLVRVIERRTQLPK